MRSFTIFILMVLATALVAQPIDRESLCRRNNPVVTSLDTMAALTVGNGHFAMTVDATGLETYPEGYSHGIPLGTMSQWGWHSFPNTEDLRREEYLDTFDFGRGHKEIYACQDRKPGRHHDASEYFRRNPHRLHLGTVGFAFNDSSAWSLYSNICDIHQSLDIWSGIITSHFRRRGAAYDVMTACHGDRDIIGADVSATEPVAITFRYPYPTGGHCDDACDWTADDRHRTTIVSGTIPQPSSPDSVILRRDIDTTHYYVIICWQDSATFEQTGPNRFTLLAKDGRLRFTCEYLNDKPDDSDVGTSYRCVNTDSVFLSSRRRWKQFWQEGAAVDFSASTAPESRELERRVMLSQYLLSVNEKDIPPAETGLTYNSWFGKFHLEMVWWHQAWLALWGHPRQLENTLDWYFRAEPIARDIAARQGLEGVRWMKMTDPSGEESPSNVGSFLIWQQPHLIYLAELLFLATGDTAVINKYGPLVEETAAMMASIVTWNKSKAELRGIIPAQETLKASTTINPPFELSYWYFALSIAQRWRLRQNKARDAYWDRIITSLPRLASDSRGRYLAAASEPDTYSETALTSDHPAVLGALGVLPASPIVDADTMAITLDWIYNNWHWDETWGWDYPMTAMTAARLGQPRRAVDALMMPRRTNTYLVNGHNYQDGRLRLYLPGNGGLLTAVAMMCAGWKGSKGANPGFPDDGTWNVRWEGLLPLP